MAGRHTLCLVTTNRHDFKLIRGRIPMATEIRNTAIDVVGDIGQRLSGMFLLAWKGQKP
jgi:hypothetical protein